MHRAPKLSITAQSVSGDPDRAQFVRDVHSSLLLSELAFYGKLIGEAEPIEVFVSETPHRALEWICRRISRPKLMKVVQHIYDHPEADTDGEEIVNGDDQENDDVLVRDTQAADTDSQVQTRIGNKRKREPKEKTTRQANKALVEKMNLALVQTIASTQDWEHAKAPEGLSVGERKYRNFAKKLPGVGLNTVTQMINKAVAVGTIEVLKDWQAIMAVWKRQHLHGKKLFQGVPDTRFLSSSQRGMIVRSGVYNSQIALTQQPRPSQPDDVGLTYEETESFRFKYFNAKKTQVDGIADDMRHRWKMDELYEEYELLEREIRKRNEGTGTRGRNYNTVAKEHLFASAYEIDLGRRATKESDPDLWADFGQFLDWGKRWNVMKKRFGSIGIFGLLPRSVISNHFIEKSLTQTRVAQWIEMVAECNEDVATMALRIEPLFRACMEESEPPTEFSFLEELDNYAGMKPLALFDSTTGDEEESPYGSTI